MAATVVGPKEDKELVGSWFSIELDNGVKGFFSDASGLSIELEVIEISQSDGSKGNVVDRKRPGIAKYGDITLKRTLSPDRVFWDWAVSIRDGKSAFRHDGAIVMADMGGKELGRWTFTNAWPSKWSCPDLDVTSTSMLTEEITLAVEGLTRTK